MSEISAGSKVTFTASPQVAPSVPEYVVSVSGTPIGLASVGSDGGFRFDGLQAGRYTLKQVDGDAIKVLREFTVVGDRAEDLGELTSP